MSANTTAIIILLVTFFALILLRVNIAFAVGIASTVCLMYLGIPLSNVAQHMVKGLNSFSLMAVPFFITMGALMGGGGISEKLIALANSLVGWMRGGLAMVNIVASYFFGENKAFGQGFEGVVHLRFREDGLHGALEHGLVEAFHVVAVHKAQAGEGADAEQGAQFVQKAGGLVAQAGLLFHIDTSDHG